MTVAMERIVTQRWRCLQRSIGCLFWVGVALGPVNPRAARAAHAPLITLQAFVAAKRHVRLPDGIDLAYVQMGNPDGMPVVLIHGYTDSALDWVPMLPYLPRNWRLIMPDLRGFGSSSKPACCYDLVDFAYDIKLLLERLHIRRADMVGFSLGSMVAQRFAETWPRSVRQVVLISSTGGTHKCRAPVDFHQFDCGMPVIRAMKRTPTENSPFMIEWFGAPSPEDRRLIKMERNDAAALPLSSWRTVLEQALTHPRLGVLLPRLKAPALLIWGSEDPIMSPEDRASLEVALPHAAVHVFAGLGHDVIWERPRRVAGVISRFLDRRASAQSPGLP
ncbi:MAG: alpha/beta fold hydrolase [Steroidobacteraceae bacterium]